jgi:hypothetical protein
MQLAPLPVPGCLRQVKPRIDAAHTRTEPWGF